VLVTFRLPPDVRAERVHVVGEFNAWSRVAHPMIKGSEGLVAEVELEGGRRHRFRYLLDGEQWANDWAADDYVANDFGGNDSVIDLGHGQPPRRPDNLSVRFPAGQPADIARAMPDAMIGDLAPPPRRRLCRRLLDLTRGAIGNAAVGRVAPLGQGVGMSLGRYGNDGQRMVMTTESCSARHRWSTPLSQTA